MRLIHCADTAKRLLDASAVTIGCFDGIHRGHRALFRALKELAGRHGIPAVVVTFEPHPLAVLAPEKKPALITSLRQKIDLIEEAGIDCLAVIPFTRELSRVDADQFVRGYLCRALGARHVVVGHDYAFGRDRGGNCATLEAMGERCGFTVRQLEPVGEGGGIFSSTMVRRLIAGGDTVRGAEVLGRSFTVTGRVIPGAAGFRAGSFGLVTEHELLPPEGSYRVVVALGDRTLPGVCRIGEGRGLEVWLRDHCVRLPQAVEVAFHERLPRSSLHPAWRYREQGAPLPLACRGGNGLVPPRILEEPCSPV